MCAHGTMPGIIAKLFPRLVLISPILHLEKYKQYGKNYSDPLCVFILDPGNSCFTHTQNTVNSSSTHTPRAVMNRSRMISCHLMNTCLGRVGV